MYLLVLGLLLAGSAFAEEPPKPPPEVEAGSVQQVYVVKEGDTLRSIADTNAFLVEDLARWNGLKDADKIEVGQQLVMWVAPREIAVVAPPPPPAPSPVPVVEPVPEKPRGDGARGFVGVQLGPTIALNPLSPAFLPRLEAGLELPSWDRRLRLFVAGTWSRPIEEGSGDDARVPGETWNYRLEQTEITVVGGATVRATGLGKVVPEFSVGPGVWLHRSVVDGDAGGAAFGESTESYATVGIYASAGVALETGPGELNFQLAFATAGFGGVVTGEAAAAALTPLVGYRLVF